MTKDLRVHHHAGKPHTHNPRKLPHTNVGASSLEASENRDVMPGYRKHHLPDSRAIKGAFLVGLFFMTFLYVGFYSILPLALAIPALLPIAILAILTLWSLPAYSYRPSKILDYLFWAFLVTLLIWPNYVAISIPGLPWITPLRVFGGPMLLLLLFYSFTSLDFKEEMSDILKTTPWIVRLVSAFSISQIISIATSLNPFDAINRVFNNQVAWTGIFFGAIWIFRQKRSLRTFMIVYICCMIFLMAVAFIEASRERIIWQDVFPSYMIVQDEAVARVLAGARRLSGEYRVVASATTPLSFAELLALSLPFAFSLLSERFSMKNIFLFCIYDLLVGYTIFLTASRLGFVGLFLAHIFFITYIVRYANASKTRSLGQWLILMAGPAVVMGLLFSVTFFGRVRRVVFGGGEHKYSNEGRSVQWEMFPNAFIDNPISGFGAGQGAQKLGYTNPSGLLTIDSYPLTILMDYGLLGAFTYFPLIFVGMGYALANARQSTGAYRSICFVFLVFLVEYLVIKTVLSQEANQPLLFLSLAGVCAASYHISQKRGLSPAEKP